VQKARWKGEGGGVWTWMRMSWDRREEKRVQKSALKKTYGARGRKNAPPWVARKGRARGEKKDPSGKGIKCSVGRGEKQEVK